MLIVFLICWQRKQSANSNQYQTMVLAGQNYQISPSPFPSRFGPKVSSLVAKKKVKSLFRYTLIWQGSRYDILTAVKKKDMIYWQRCNEKKWFFIKKKSEDKKPSRKMIMGGSISRPWENANPFASRRTPIWHNTGAHLLLCVCGGDKVK